MSASSSSDPSVKAAPFRMRATSFVGLASALTVLVLVIASIGMLYHMDTIAQRAITARKEALPDFIDNQGAVITIGNLRRLAEVVYVSDEPRVRRRARIDAKALAAESVFDHEKGVQEQAQHVALLITQLALQKDTIHRKMEEMKSTATSYLETAHELALQLPSQEDSRLVMDAVFFLSTTASPFVQSATFLRDRRPAENPHLNLIGDTCRRNAATMDSLLSLCAQIGHLRIEYTTLIGQIQGMESMPRRQWQEIDAILLEMRDNVSSAGEMSILDKLRSIEETTQAAHQTLFVLFFASALFLTAFVFVVHHFMVRPIQWTSRKLTDIQQGVLKGDIPLIRIQELNDVANLLGRFSSHLAELYSHTSQLEEDAAHKRDLEETMRALYQASQDGHLTWNAEGVFYVNPGFLNLVGAKDREELFDNWDRMGFSIDSRLLNIFQCVIEEKVCREDITLTTMDGQEIPCEVTHVAIERRGKPAVLSYIRDMSIQKQNETALRLAKEQAEEAAKAKSSFLARMSHEIRTPMNGVLGLTHLALKSDSASNQKSYLKKIQSSAKILLGVINDILDFSKIESGNMVLEAAPFSLHSMLGTIEDVFLSQAEQKGLTFSLEKDGNLPDWVEGDALRLSQILLNLCGNAVKFTSHGQIILRINVIGRSEGALRLRFEVIDTGIGISPDQFKNLFQPFSQADISTTRKYGGTGLGLVISKLLVRMMGGKLTVKSTLNRGSTFSFEIPVKVATEEIAILNALPEPTGDSLEGIRILLAEDNEINQEIAIALLEDLGIEVTLAQNGAEAIDILKTTDFHGILMDIQMPVMDGLTATHLIRTEGRKEVRELPIIALTAHALQEDRAKSLAAGMNDHITKPIDVVELHDKLRRWIACARG